MDLYPTHTVIKKLRELDEKWADLECDLLDPETVAPVMGSPTRRRIFGKRFVGYVEPTTTDETAWLVVGARLRERAPAGLAEAVVGIEPKPKRSSRRGGSGKRWPSTWKELRGRIDLVAGCSTEMGSTHINVYRDGKKVDVLPCTSSDYRALMNACHQLRQKGINVSRVG